MYYIGIRKGVIKNANYAFFKFLSKLAYYKSEFKN
jgi:hypothetical protein